MSGGFACSSDRWSRGGGVVLALCCALAACGGGGEEVAADRSSREAGAESAPAAAEEIPERDVSGIDVCAALPAEALAEATGLPVAEPPWRMDYDPSPNCTYRLRGSSGSGERIDIVLQELFDYDWARQTAESFDREIEEIEDLGAAAYLKKTPDGWWDVWAKRRDGLVVNAMAFEREPAITAARVALDRIQ